MLLVALVAVFALGTTAQSWPRGCTSSSGMDPSIIQRFLGAGGVGPVKLGANSTFVSRFKLCNSITGCTPWTYGYNNATFPQYTGYVAQFIAPQLWMGIAQNKLYLRLRSPSGVQDCTSTDVAFAPNLATNITWPMLQMAFKTPNYNGCGYLAAGGTYKYVPMTGTVTNTCASLFSAETRVDNIGNGWSINQYAWTTRWSLPAAPGKITIH